MVRLILEEGGNKRAFKLNDGTLTIGSADSCSLTLESDDVAGEHAELVIEAGEVILKPRPGVKPPSMNGVPVSADKSVPLGASFKIGKAVLRVEDPDAPAAAAPKRAKRGHKAVGTPRSDTHGERAVHRTRPVATIEKGMPSWLIVLLLLTFGVGGAYWFLKDVGEQATSGTDSVEETLLYAESHFGVGNRKMANAKLAMIDEKDLNTPNLRERYAALKNSLDTIDATEETNILNQAGSVYLSSQLKNFESSRLKGKPHVKKIRVFLLRCKEFRERFPDHPDMDWVTRQESRFRNNVDITQPATFEEIAYEIETLTWAWPHRYGKAFAKLEPYLSGPDAEAALELQKSLNAERDANFLDRMQQAKFEWTNEEKGNKGTAAEILRALTVNYGDPSMVEQAATELTKLPGVKGLMEAWKKTKPHLFEEMMENETLRGYARRQGLL